MTKTSRQLVRDALREQVATAPKLIEPYPRVGRRVVSDPDSGRRCGGRVGDRRWWPPGRLRYVRRRRPRAQVPLVSRLGVGGFSERSRAGRCMADTGYGRRRRRADFEAESGVPACPPGNHGAGAGTPGHRHVELPTRLRHGKVADRSARVVVLRPGWLERPCRGRRPIRRGTRRHAPRCSRRDSPTPRGAPNSSCWLRRAPARCSSLTAPLLQRPHRAQRCVAADGIAVKSVPTGSIGSLSPRRAGREDRRCETGTCKPSRSAPTFEGVAAPFEPLGAPSLHAERGASQIRRYSRRRCITSGCWCCRAARQTAFR